MVIPTLNEEKNIDRVLKSIYSQDYPKESLEVFVVDNESIDNTLKIAKKYPVKIILSTVKDAQYGKMLAFKKSKGEYFIYIDADIEFRHNQYLKMMLKPLLEDKEIVGSFTRMYISKEDGLLNRYLTLDPLQRDPIYEFFSPSIESVITERKLGYDICRYFLGKIPPAGRCLFRVKYVKDSPINKAVKFMDLDNLAILVKAGYNKFAYVPEAGYYHHHAGSFRQLIQKRLRNINRNYLPDMENRHYTWFAVNNGKDAIKIVLLLLYAHSIILPFLRGLYRSVKHREVAGLLEPFVILTLTDTIIYGFLSSPVGRTAAQKLVKALFRIRI